MSICEQKIQHKSVPSKLKTWVCCWPPSFCCCSMYLKHKVHTVMLENIFQQQQRCTNHWWPVACGTIFCAVVPWYFWVLCVELPSCHITGVWNFKVHSRFWRSLCILEWNCSNSSLSHVTCILSKLIFNILNFWMVQRACCHVHIYVNLPYSLYVLFSSKYWYFNVLKNYDGFFHLY